ncbi:glycosyltransferase family 4 protein [Priestia megaterium]
MIGSAGYLEKGITMGIRGTMQKLELSNLVRFLGTSNDVAHFLREADIFVHPSIHDTQPYSVMEAQLTGLPVLVSNTAGLPEMVEVGRSGLVSSVGNIHELYYQLRYLLENDILRKQLAECTKEWAKNGGPLIPWLIMFCHCISRLKLWKQKIQCK